MKQKFNEPAHVVHTQRGLVQLLVCHISTVCEHFRLSHHRGNKKVITMAKKEVNHIQWNELCIVEITVDNAPSTHAFKTRTMACPYKATAS